MPLLEDFSLKTYNTFGVEAIAKQFASFDTIETLDGIVKSTDFSEPFLILGGGSNILFTQDFDGLVLRNQIKGITVVQETTEHVWVKSGAGEGWHDLVLYALAHDLGGIENLALIPGTIGAAPIQNIGAYGVELKDTFVSLEAYNIAAQRAEIFNAIDCHFGYRDSIFKRDAKGWYVITAVTLQLKKKPHTLHINYGAISETLEQQGIKDINIKAVADAVISIRQSKLPNPVELGSAGSFFKNSVIENVLYDKLKARYPDLPGYPAGKEGYIKIAAGWLIEKAGWKGKTIGNKGVHKDQALILVNYGGATGKEILELARDIQNDVQQKFGVMLETEVNII